MNNEQLKQKIEELKKLSKKNYGKKHNDYKEIVKVKDGIKEIKWVKNKEV